MRHLRRPFALLLAAAALALPAPSAFAGEPIPPEKQTGSVGPTLIVDGPAMTAATCRYSDTLPLKLRSVIVKPPKVYWPDTNSDVDNQHGKVRHRVIVQRSTDGGSTWSLYRASAVQSAIAGEKVAAPLTKRTVSISLASKTTVFRVVSKIQWIRPNGSVRGTLLHWYHSTRWASDQLQGTIEPGPCANKLVN
jgi:hypothetical protein